MIADAVDTAFTLGWALAAWIGLMAVTVTVQGSRWSSSGGSSHGARGGAWRPLSRSYSTPAPPSRTATLLKPHRPRYAPRRRGP